MAYTGQFFGAGKDSQGNVYAAGYLNAAGPIVAKYSSGLTYISSQTFPVNGYAYGVSPDSSGNLVIVGGFPAGFTMKLDANLNFVSSASASGFGYLYDLIEVGTGTFIASGEAGFDIALYKFDSDLAMISSVTVPDANGADYGRGISLAPDGTIYVAGYINTPAEADAIWVGHFDQSLNLLGSVTTNLSGMGERGHDVSVGPDGSVFVTGYAVPGPGTACCTPWIGKYNSSLSLVASTRTGLSGQGYGIMADPNGNVWVAGKAKDSNMQSWIARFDPNLVLKSSFSSSASGSDGANTIFAAGASAIFAAGYDSGLGESNPWIGKYADSDALSTPGSVTGIAGSAVGTSSVSWTWNPASGAQSYSVYSGTGGFLGASASTGFVHQGISPNSPSGITVAAVSWFSTGTLSSLVTTYSSAQGPDSGAVLWVTSGSIRYAWNTGSNPAGTEFEVQTATSSDFTTMTSGGWSADATSVTVSGLNSRTTYYLRVRARNADGVATAFDSSVSTMTNPNPISFELLWGSPDYYGSAEAAPGDYDGDGDLDIAAAFSGPSDKTNRIFRNNGSGTLSAIWFSARTETTYSAAWGDCDNDGDLDIAFGNGYGGFPDQPNVRLFGNGGGDSFSEVWASTDTDDNEQLAWADFDNDGRLDILSVNDDFFSPSKTRVYRNLGDSSFTSVWSAAGVSGFKGGAAGDYDNDGSLDILAAAQGGWPAFNRVFRGDGAGGFSPVWASTEVGGGRAALWADADQDGWLDAFFMNPNSGYKLDVYRFDGSTFSHVSEARLSLGAHLTLSDFDGDGNLDVGVLRSGSGIASGTAVLQQSPPMKFSTAWYSPHGIAGGGASIHSGDFSGDGQADLLVSDCCNFGEPDIKVYRNTSSAANAPPNPPSAGFDSAFDSLTGILTLKWDHGSDDRTPAEALFYTVRAGTSSGGGELIGGLRAPVLGTFSQSERVSTGQPGRRLRGLSPGATVYWRVRSIDGGGTAGSWSAEQSVVLTHSSVTTLSGTASGVSSISWSWPDLEGESGYQIISSTGGAVSEVLPAGTTTWSETGLDTNTAYARKVVSLFSSQAATSAAATVYTAAAVPGNSTAAVSGPYTLSISWSSGGNPAGTTYSIEGSTDASYTVFQSSMRTQALSGGLVDLFANATNFVRVRAENGDGEATAYASMVSTLTPAVAPSSPSIVSVGPGSVMLDWSANGNVEPGTDFEVQRSTDGSVYSYSAPTSSSSYSDPFLEPGTTYYYRIRTRDRWGGLTDFAGVLAATTTAGASDFFLFWSESGPDNPSGTAWGDFDGDGLLDFAVANRFHPNRVYRNAGGAAFSTVWSTPEDETTYAVAWADVDNDGDLDLLFGNDDSGAPTARLYGNAGGGSFSSLWSSTETNSTQGVSFGDFDSDGDPDFVVSGYGFSNGNTMVHRNGGAAFVRVWSSPPSGYFFDAVWGDSDNDGNLDILMGSTNQPARVYRGDGNGGFSEVWGSTESGIARSVRWLDVDRDGYLDLITAFGNSSYKLRYFRNSGSSFTLTTAATLSLDDYIALGDVDSDGDLDVVSSRNGSGGSQGHRVFLQDGTGGFSNSGTWSSSEGFNTPGHPDLGDMDGDGRPDFVAGMYSSDPRLRVYRGASLSTSSPPSPPSSGFSTTYDFSQQIVTLNWNPGSDTETPPGGLVYVVRAGTSPGAGNIVSGVQTPRLGNFVQPQRTSAFQLGRRIRGLEPGATVYWSVRAIDTGGAFSAWSAEQSVFVSNPPDCSQRTSVRSGLWSDAGTWTTGSPPNGCSSVTVATGHIVTVDTLEAAASTTSVYGTLSFSRVTSSSLTMVGGDLNIESGGMLDMGTEASPVPLGVNAHLVLAYGSPGRRFGLKVNGGGFFSVFGAPKAPFSQAAGDVLTGATSLSLSGSTAAYGWGVGDEIVIGDTLNDPASLSERRTIASVSSGPAPTISWAVPVSTSHYSTGPLIVANLTRNVVVRSSGTDTDSNTSRILAWTAGQLGFSIVNGEVSSIGFFGFLSYGLELYGEGASCLVSSSSIHDGYRGLVLAKADDSLVERSVFFNNREEGISSSEGTDRTVISGNFFASNGSNEDGLVFWSGTGNVVDGNHFSSKGGFKALTGFSGNSVTRNRFLSTDGVFFGGADHNFVAWNEVLYSPGDAGFWFGGAQGNSVVENVSRDNRNRGFFVTDDASVRNLFFGNESYGNENGFELSLASSTFLFDRSYANSSSGLLIRAGVVGARFVGSRFGYDQSGLSRPNAYCETHSWSGKARVVFDRVQVNPIKGICPSFGEPEKYLISYGQDADSGTVRIFGDYVVSRATFTLDYALPLLPSEATPPKLIRGSGHSATVTATFDEAAVSQIIAIEFRGNQWHVDGTVSGPDMIAPFSGSASALDIPASAPQVRIDFFDDGTANEGDRVDFALIAATGDENREKRLLFGRPYGLFNGGGSKLTVATDGAVSLRGREGLPVALDLLPGASYYSVVSSGSFAAEFSSITNINHLGLQLSGSVGVAISSTVFDYLGSQTPGSTGAYITARSLTSVATMTNVSFGLSASSTGFGALYNVDASSAGPGLRWNFNGMGGQLWGADFELDPAGAVSWGVPPIGSPTLYGYSYGVSSVTWSWSVVEDADWYKVYLATDTSSAIYETTGTDFVHRGLSPNTPSALVVAGGNAAGEGPLSSASTYYSRPAVPSVFVSSVTGTSVSLSWGSSGNPLGTVVHVSRSTSSSFETSSAIQSTATQATFPGLEAWTTYYFRSIAFNFDGRSSGYGPVVSTVTKPSADVCEVRVSLRAGNWSDPSVWSGGAAPVGCNAVRVVAGHTITLDTTTATAGETLVHGILSFSRVVDSSLTIVGADLVVKDGGILDMGTQSSPIPEDVNAHLILALGGKANEFELVVESGGSFLAHGATKTPYAFSVSDALEGATSLLVAGSTSSAGWAPGDRIVIGDTLHGDVNRNEERMIASISAGPTTAITWAVPLSTSHFSTGPLIVANLSRNVLVRSSGTNGDANQSQVVFESAAPDAIDIRSSEFAYLNLNWWYEGSGGRFSSSTVRDSFTGIRVTNADDFVIEKSVFWGAGASTGYAADRIAWFENVFLDKSNFGGGLALNGATENRLIGNHFIRTSMSLGGNSARNLMAGNRFLGGSLRLDQSNFNRLVSNKLRRGGGVAVIGDSNTLIDNLEVGSEGRNSETGFEVNGTRNLLVGNSADSNYYGTFVNGAQNLFLAHSIFSSSFYGIWIYSGASGNEFIDMSLGYGASGESAPDGYCEIQHSASQPMILRGSRVNPSPGVCPTGFGAPGDSLVSFNPDGAPGIVYLQGHLILSGETMELDFSRNLRESSATTPKLMSGTGHSAAVVATYDSESVSQLIEIEFRNGMWHVDGSSSGVDMAVPFAGSQTGLDIPAQSPQFRLNFVSGPSPREGDLVDFALVAASGDENIQKRLRFGPGSLSQNQGASKLAVAPDGALVLRGKEGAPTTMELAAGSTCFAFVSSGAFTAEFSSITNIDHRGLQLSGSAGVSIDSTTIDLLGFGPGDNAYITARALVSSATLDSVAFGTRRSSSGAGAVYNVDVQGVDSGLSWLMTTPNGPLWSQTFERDPNDRISWSAPDVAVSVPTGTALGLSSVFWSWSSDRPVEVYRVHSGSAPGIVFSTQAGSDFVHAGLGPNAPSVIAVSGRGKAGFGPLSPAATAHTLARPPTETAADWVRASSAAVSWSPNGNPAYTLAAVQRSTDGVSFAQVLSAAATWFVDSGLLGCTTYFYRVRNANVDGHSTAFDSTMQFMTAGSTPAPPGELRADSLAGRIISLSWNKSPFGGVTEYRIFYASGTLPIDYSTPLAVVTSTVTSYRTGPLDSGVSYEFGLRARNRCGIEEANTRVRAAATALQSLTGVRARIKAPQSGRKITGNRVTVIAELTLGDPGQTGKILFQCKVSTASSWMDIPAASVEHPNPDRTAPYFVHWNVDALGTDDYDLRAVATDIFGATDPSPASVTVTVDPVDFDVDETHLAGGKVRTRQKIHKEIDNTIQASDEGTAQVTELMIPTGAIFDSTTTVTVVNNPDSVPPTPEDAVSIGAVTRIDLSNGQTQLDAGKIAAVTITFPDSDGNGFVDGTASPATELEMYSAETLAGPWKKDLSSSVDLAAKTVTGRTSHFSFFALFAPQGANLSAIRVYPVPFVPNNGNADDGVPYAAGNANSGIVFDNLPASVCLAIFTIRGEEVDNICSDSSGGRLQWNVINGDGRDVASGGYIAVITSPGSAVETRKLLIAR